MGKEIERTRQLAQDLLEMIRDMFGDDQNFQVQIETPDGKVSLGCKDCDYKTEEPLKRESELTIGEKYILYLLNNKNLNPEAISFDNVIDTIINNPLYDFMIAQLNPETKNEVLNFLSELTESLVKVDFSKIRKVKH